MAMNSSSVKLFVLILLIILFSGCSSDNPVESNPEELNGLNALFQLGRTPGACLVIIKDFQVDTVITYGVKDHDTQEPVTPQTLFQAASISKPVTAVAAMKFVQDGMILLNEDVNNKLISWQVPENQFTVTEKVTLKRLLAHRGGIPQGGKVGVPREQTLPTLLQILNGDPPYPAIQVQYIPGSDFVYSNEGFCIIQQLLIDLSGQTFPNLLQEMVLDPLEMNSSTFEQHLPPELASRTASGHKGYDVLEGKYQYHPKLAAAGLWTTAEDLAKFMIEFLLSLKGESNKILSQGMITQMTEPVTLYDEGKDYGLGLGIKYFGGQTYYWHSGGFEGFNCVMYGHESAGVGMVLMTNYTDLEWETFIGLIGTQKNWPGFNSN
jgi:CubicO group peptidase (beta-lactamase class C family)